MLAALLLLFALVRARPVGPLPRAWPARQLAFETPLLTPPVADFATPSADPDAGPGPSFEASFAPAAPEPSRVQPPQLPARTDAPLTDATDAPLSDATPAPLSDVADAPRSALISPAVGALPATSRTPQPTSQPLVTPSATPLNPALNASSSPPLMPPSQTPSQPSPSTDVSDAARGGTPAPDDPSNPRLAGAETPAEDDENRRATAAPSTTPAPTSANTPHITPLVTPTRASTVTPPPTTSSNSAPGTNDTASEEPPEPSSPPASPSPLPSPVMSQRITCFPAGATVQLASGAVVPMHALALGDAVHVGHGRYSPVHMFTHRVRASLHEFVRLTTASGRALTVSPGHYVYVGDVLKAARHVRVGDPLPLGDGGFSAVESVETVLARGLYNPQTEAGDIVVDGIKASVYTEAIQPALAHSALLPLRALFSLFGVSTHCAEHGFPRFVPYNVRSFLAAR